MQSPEALQHARELSIASSRAYRERQRLARVVAIDDLAVTCWCEAEILHLSRALVLECRTDSCGRPDCTEAR